MLPLLDASQDQGRPEHQGTTPGLKETLLGTLHWMRRQALRRRPGRCPAQFLISFQVEKSTQNPLSAQEHIMAPAGQVHHGHTYCGLGLQMPALAWGDWTEGHSPRTTEDTS